MSRSAAFTSWARVLESGAPMRRDGDDDGDEDDEDDEDEDGVATPTPCHTAWPMLSNRTVLCGRSARGARATGQGEQGVTDWTTIDFFSDESLVDDPYPYFDHLRDQCPVLPLAHHGVVAVTGYDEAAEVYRDTATFSSCNSVVGPFAAFPVPLEGDDVGDVVDRHRDQLPMHEHMVTMDPPDHTRERALLMRLITPKRLRDNEAFMWRLADQQLDELLADGRCEFIGAYTQPFAMLVVADLLGVPEADHERFRQGFGLSKSPGAVGAADDGSGDLNPLAWLDDWFGRYVEDRRREPRRDVLTDLALATYPDGTIPDVTSVVRTATFLFAAGQETTARLLAAALLHLAEHTELQDELRTHKDRIPEFVEEVLRVESPVKADFRLARRTTTIGGVEVPAGTPVMLLNGAANRDPRRFECPAEFRVGRSDGQAHLAFGRGPHACPGGPLARTEGRISIERILDRMRDIRISEEHHGPPDDRRFRYEPTWILRGLTSLHLEFTPIDGPAPASPTAPATPGETGR
jgi:cytochrome P450